jgi:hypothetical protein
LSSSAPKTAGESNHRRSNARHSLQAPEQLWEGEIHAQEMSPVDLAMGERGNERVGSISHVDQ